MYTGGNAIFSQKEITDNKIMILEPHPDFPTVSTGIHFDLEMKSGIAARLLQTNLTGRHIQSLKEIKEHKTKDGLLYELYFIEGDSYLVKEEYRIEDRVRFTAIGTLD